MDPIQSSVQTGRFWPVPPIPREMSQHGRVVGRLVEDPKTPLPSVTGVTASQSTEWDKTLAQRLVREQEKLAIHELLRQGELVIRGINFSENRWKKFGSECDYQRNPPEPRPGTLLWLGRRIGLFTTGRMLLHLVLAPVEDLYPHKQDVSSNKHQSVHTEPKRMCADRRCLRVKIEEQDNRLESPYLLRTSGHMGIDGRNCSGHDKVLCLHDVDEINRGYFSYNELITTGYRTEHYRCVMIPQPLTIDAICQKLRAKYQFEQELSVPELPLVLYQPRSGSISDIVFASELGITEDTLPALEATLDRIKRFSGCAGCFHLWEVITQLPLARMLAFLRNPPAAFVHKTQELEQLSPYREQLRQAVIQGDLDNVVWYCQRGADPKATYYAPGLYPNDRPLGNLLDILLSTEGGLPYDVRYTFQTHPHRVIQRQKVSKLLYECGCPVAMDEKLIAKLPSLLVHMIKRGESFPSSPPMHRLFELFFDYGSAGVIDQDELDTLIVAVKQLVGQRAMDDSYTKFLQQELSIRGKNSVGNQLPNIDSRNKSLPSFAEKFAAVAPTLARFGIVADTQQLRWDTRLCRLNEKAERMQNQSKDLHLVAERLDSVREPCADPDSSRAEQLIARARFGLKVSNFWLYPDAEQWQPDSPQAPAYQIADCLLRDDVEAARSLVRDRYHRLFEFVEEKKQALFQMYQQLDDLQNSQECLSARANSQTGKVTAQVQGETSGKNRAGQRIKRATNSRKPAVPLADPFDWLRELFREAPDTSGKSYSQLAQLAIDHYYRMPHPDQAVQLALAVEPIPEQLKQRHGVDHVIRTQILAEALLDLLARHDPEFKALLAQKSDLLELIPLAMVYHDICAEVEEKAVRELRAAQLFARDMGRAGRHSTTVIAQVAVALGHKESDVVPCPTSQLAPKSAERLICRVLRLADRIDSIRTKAITKQWQQPQDRACRLAFNYSLLDLPEPVSENLRQEFHALLEGAKDLAYVTGGIPPFDHSESRSYLDRHHLHVDNDRRKRKMTWTNNAYDRVTTELDDNVRRALAEAAGITTCTEDHSKESVQRHGGRLPCLEERDGRDTLTRIHSELELRQIQLPQQMTPEHKLMFAQMLQQGDLTYLPETIRTELRQEIARLKQHGIRPPLGTLTQEVLASPEAQAQLKKQYQLQVVWQRRYCGTDEQGEARYDTFLVPRPAWEQPDDEPVVPAAKRLPVGEGMSL